MLQIANAPPISSGASSPFASTEPAELVRLALGFLRRQYLIILICLLLALSVGAVYAYVTPRTYSASTLVMMEARTGQFSPERSILGEIPGNSAWSDSQMVIIRAEDVLESVVRKLKLDTVPEFTDSRSFLRRFADRLDEDKTDHADPASEMDRVQRAVDTLQRNLDVNRVGYVIEIRFRARNADLAAQIANAVAEAYLNEQIAAKVQAGRRASDWLQERLQTLREQSVTAERAVIEFKLKNSIVAAEGKLIKEQQLMDLNTRLVAAKASMGEAEARLNQIKVVLQDKRLNSTITAVSDSLSNPIIVKLRTQYLELVNRENEWSARYGKNHVAVVRIRHQLEDIEKSIHDELSRIAESYKSDYAVAKARMIENEKQLAAMIAETQQTNRAQITLRTLESTAQSYRALYDNFLRRHTEAQQAFPNSEARVISAASPQWSVSQPRKLFVGALAALGGLALGFGIALLRELMDRTFRTTGQVHPAVGVECVALVPQLKPARAKTLSRLKRNPPDMVRRLISCDANAVREVINSPSSSFAEAIRSIKVAVDTNPDLTSAKIIGLISSVPGEGKSTIALALGELMAQTGARVTLVDCDLRNPSLSRAIAPKTKAGLMDVVFARQRLEDVVWTDDRTGMTFIPSVRASQSTHSSDILSSVAMKDLFDELRANNDYVIVDLSPLAAGVDVRLTTGFIDAYVLVVKWGQTTIDVVQHALDTAHSVQQSLVGVVLNQINFKQLNRYDSHHAKYYYGSQMTLS